MPARTVRFLFIKQPCRYTQRFFLNRLYIIIYIYMFMYRVEPEKEVPSGPLRTYQNRRLARANMFTKYSEIPVLRYCEIRPSEHCFETLEMFFNTISFSLKLHILTFSPLFKKPREKNQARIRHAKNNITYFSPKHLPIWIRLVFQFSIF